METPERPDLSLPSPWTQAGTPAPYVPSAASWEELPDPDAPSGGRKLTPGLLVRAVRRYWWQILLLWGVGSTAMAVMVYKKVKPTYDASTWLRVEQGRSPLGVTLDAGAATDGTFMETQVQLITSHSVMDVVIQNPKVAGLPTVRSSTDPEADLRRKLQVAIPPKTNLIVISMASPYPNEAAVVVNAVAEAYLESSAGWVDQTTQQQIAELKKYKETYYNNMVKAREELQALADRGASPDPRDSPQEALNSYRMYRDRLDQIQLELIDAEATVQTLTELQRQSGGAQAATASAAPVELSPAQIDQAVQQAFRADRQVVDLHQEMASVKQQLQAARRTASRGFDPAVVKFDRDLQRLNQENERLWQQMQPRLRAQLTDSMQQEASADPIATSLQEATVRAGKLKQEKTHVEAALDGLKIDQNAEGNEALQARFTSEDLVGYTDMHKKVSLALESLEMQVDGPSKITLIDQAEASAAPSSDRRKMLMASAPVGVLGVVLALFVLLELRAPGWPTPRSCPAGCAWGLSASCRPCRACRRRRARRRSATSAANSRSSSRAWTTCG